MSMAHTPARKRWLVFVIMILCLTSLLLSCSDRNDKQAIPATTEGAAGQPSTTPEDSVSSSDTTTDTTSSLPPEKTYTKEAKLLAVGDVMMHMPQMPAYYNAKTKTYNFNSFFSEVKPILEQGDWVWANLETPIGGADLRYSGFPMFNGPPELAQALKYAGFNIVTTANNHALDRKEIGVKRTLARLKEQGFVTKGTAASAEEAEQLTIVTKNEINMGILAYTYGTNGLTVPSDKPYLISLIDEAKIKSDIAKLRSAGADVVVIALHFGIEYQRQPNGDQKALAYSLIQSGADIILGSHPHVVQPYEEVIVTRADGTAKTGYVIYSMGNFISNMKDEYTDYGVIFSANIQKQFPQGTIKITDVKAIPTWVEKIYTKKHRKYVVLPVEQTIKKRNHSTLHSSDYKKLEQKLAALNKHLGSMSVPVQVQSTVD